MSKYVYLLLLILISHLDAAVAHAAKDSTSVHMETLEFGELATGRASTINVWFPQGKCKEQKERQFCLTDTAITNKVIVFSHGSMGSALEYSWIGEKLAAEGLIVVGVNHFGESSIYGKESQNPRNTALIWQRPQDISALLDKLANHNFFQRKVNWSNVVAIGHSSGGQTAAMLAGATFDLQRLIDYCDSEQSKFDLSCNYGRNRKSAPEAFRKQFGTSQQDQRIKIVVMLDPALGSAVQAESLRKLKIPTLVVGAKNNDFLPWSQHGLRYATEILGAKTNLLTGQEGHFVFLNPCHHQGKVMGVPLCQDRKNVNRNLTQEVIAKNMIEFIRINPAAFAEQGPRTTQTRQYSTSSPLDILIYTPHWVWGLLLGLVVFGVLQARTRQVKIQVALIMPVAMLLLSLSGMLRYVGWQVPALSCWLLSLGLITTLLLKFMNKNIVKFDFSHRKLEIQGSWWPLIVILGIFFTRYALGVATAMESPIIHEPYFQETMGIVLGGWSGFFLARGIIFWRAKK